MFSRINRRSCRYKSAEDLCSAWQWILVVKYLKNVEQKFVIIALFLSLSIVTWLQRSFMVEQRDWMGDFRR